MAVPGQRVVITSDRYADRAEVYDGDLLRLGLDSIHFSQHPRYINCPRKGKIGRLVGHVPLCLHRPGGFGRADRRGEPVSHWTLDSVALHGQTQAANYMAGAAGQWLVTFLLMT